MKRIILISGICILQLDAIFACKAQNEPKLPNPEELQIEVPEGYVLLWSDEFNYTGLPHPYCWIYEEGFERGEELQWYQPVNTGNAVCRDGKLLITARKERVRNPQYDPDSKWWKTNREYAEYTSASILTKGRFDFKYGRFETRAKIPVASGSWPAIWTEGREMSWPNNGEVDVMEFYRRDKVGEPIILANAAWGSDRDKSPVWDDTRIPLTHFTAKDPDWTNKFHIWVMDWDENYIRLYLDGELLNEIDLGRTINGLVGNYTNPFKQPHFIRLNLAVGSMGGTPDDTAFPLVYEVDYVRVFQKKQ